MPPLAVAIRKKSKDVLRGLFNGNMVATNFPLRLSNVTELEPDVLVAPGCADDYADHGVDAAHVALVVELADGPSAYDQQWKERLYAESRIADYWFVSLAERTVEVRRQPENGHYQELAVYKENEAVAPLAAPHASVPVARLLPLARKPEGI